MLVGTERGSQSKRWEPVSLRRTSPKDREAGRGAPKAGTIFDFWTGWPKMPKPCPPWQPPLTARASSGDVLLRGDRLPYPHMTLLAHRHLS